jgi:hypothetical protein
MAHPAESRHVHLLVALHLYTFTLLGDGQDLLSSEDETASTTNYDTDSLLNE